jgi:putative transposase
MPNHVHAIIEINKKYIKNNHISACRDRSRPVPTDIALTPTIAMDITSGNITDDNIKIKSLSELIGAFKTTTSKIIHQNGFNEFKWQRSFFDRIIRNEKMFNYVYNYTINNPAMWNRDRNNIN